MDKKQFRVPPAPSENVRQGPPTAIDLEQAVISAILLDKNAFAKVKDILESNMFFVQTYSIIYNACNELVNNGSVIDILTVSDHLKRKGKLDAIGGDFKLIELTQKTFSSAHIEFHARIIIQKYVLREMIRVSNYMLSHSYHSDPDIFDVLDYNKHHVNRLMNTLKIDGVQRLNPKEELKRKMINNMSGRLSGVPTTISEFNDKCGGFQDREFIIIAARPGMGKTTIVVALLFHLIFEQRIPSAFFSLEMGLVDIYNRFASKITGIPFMSIKDGKIDGRQQKEINNAFDLIEQSCLSFSTEKYYYTLIEEIKKFVKENGVKIVFIDYAQLIMITENAKDATGELRTITRGLKALALQLNIPIIALSQLDRNLDNKHDQRPNLSDLKLSGSLEEDADTVIFPFRPAYYKKDVSLPKKEMGRLEWDVAKGRNIGTFKLEAFLDVIRMELYSMSDYED